MTPLGNEKARLTMRANAIVNPWDGEGFRFPHCICWVCGKQATVAEFADRYGGLMARICSPCLDEAQTAINEAILKRQASAEKTGP
jgi:hypothetical protein